MEAYKSTEQFMVNNIIQLINDDKLNAAKNILKNLLVECPNIVEVKLLYSLVLSRMGDFHMAQAYLQEFLDNSDLEKEELKEIHKYLTNVVSSKNYN